MKGKQYQMIFWAEPDDARANNGPLLRLNGRALSECAIRCAMSSRHAAEMPDRSMVTSLNLTAWGCDMTATASSFHSV